MEGWRNKGKLLIDFIRLRTSPVAVKLLKDGDGFPDGALRPLKNLGFPMAICQGMGMARRSGLTVGFSSEESACPPSNLFFGWAELKDEMDIANAWLKMGTYKDLEAAKRGLESRPRFAKGEYHGIIFSPLDSTTIIPDVILVYCDSAQAMVLTGASCYKDGVGLTFFKPLQASAVCVESIISTKLSGRFQLAIPCGGDRRLEATEDDELIFSIPSDRLDDIIDWIEAKRRSGSRPYPTSRNLQVQPELNKYYEELRKKMTPIT